MRGPGLILLGLLAACGEQAGREPPAVTRQAADSASIGIAARLEQLVWNQSLTVRGPMTMPVGLQ